MGPAASGGRTVEPIRRGGPPMRKVTYEMGVSTDGYIVGPDGGFDWTPPDDEIFRFAIDQIRAVGVHLMGRRLYETMLYWETADQDPSLDDAMLEWAAIWNPLPKWCSPPRCRRWQGKAPLAPAGRGGGSGGCGPSPGGAATRSGGG